MGRRAKRVGANEGGAFDLAQAGMSLDVALRLCAERGVRLTSMRSRVLELLLDSELPCKAYELIAALGARLGRKVNPPTVYRALEFLVDQGLAHRLEGQRRFVPGAPGMQGHGCLLCICEACGKAITVDAGDVEAELALSASALGFVIHRSVLETRGRCPQCVPNNEDS